MSCRLGWTMILLAFLAVSCEKKEATPSIDEETGIDKSKVYRDDPAEDQLKEDVWYYFKVLSLWQDNVPPVAYDQLYKITEDNYIRDNYTQYFPTAEQVLDFLVDKTPADYSGKPIDRFSFLDRAGVVSGEIQDAVVTSFGMHVFFLQTQEAKDDNDNAYLYVRMVDKGSPADLLGIRRGDRILQMNGRSDLDYNAQLAQGFHGVEQALRSSSMTIRVVRPNGEELTGTMNGTSYAFNPILSEKVLVQDDKKIGYLAFSSFVSVVSDSGLPTAMYHELERIFGDFQAQAIDEMVIDLRYNGGGSVATAEYLVNTLAPSSANNRQMYYYKLNKLLTQEWKWTRPDSVFAPIMIAKNGMLELNKVYFLVTQNTASASELVINALKPYMNVQVIGPEKTYGKPVGFFPVEVGADEEAEVYVTSFQMYNSMGYGDYFEGINLNKQAYEDYFKDFGNPEESLLAHALYHIRHNRYATSPIGKSASANGSGRFDRSPRAKSIKIGPPRAGDMGMFTFPKTKQKIE